MPRSGPYRKLGLIRHMREHVAQYRMVPRRVHEIKSILRANARLDRFPIRHNVLNANTPLVKGTGSTCVFFRIPCRVSSTMRLRGEDKTLVIDAHASKPKDVFMYCDVLGPIACRECTQVHRRKQFDTDVYQAHPTPEVNQRTMHVKRRLGSGVRRLPPLTSSTIITCRPTPRAARPPSSRSSEPQPPSTRSSDPQPPSTRSSEPQPPSTRSTELQLPAKLPQPVRPSPVTDNELHLRVIEKQRQAVMETQPEEDTPRPLPVSPKRASAGSRQVSWCSDIRIPMVSSRESSYVSRSLSGESHQSADGTQATTT